VSRVALLDVNLLVALFDPAHVHHDLAHDWFGGQRSVGWATCPLTENGFVRVVSHPSYANPPHRPLDLLARLEKLRTSGHHEFWPDDVSLTDGKRVHSRFLASHRHVTDVYLLALAVRHGGCLATFDRSVPIKAVQGASTRSLLVIAAAQ
jgi:toxin-antitoxin system PIN domain toxin